MQKTKKKEETHFLVTYRDPKDGKVQTLKCKKIEDSRLGLSFVSISQFIFSDSNLVADPTEENLKKRFEGTKALHLSVYSILSIEEVGSDHKGLNFKKDKSNLIMLPKDIFTFNPN